MNNRIDTEYYTNTPSSSSYSAFSPYPNHSRTSANNFNFQLNQTTSHYTNSTPYYNSNEESYPSSLSPISYHVPSSPFSSSQSVDSKGSLLKRKDFLGVDDSAKSHPNRTYFYKRVSDLDTVVSECNKKLQEENNTANKINLLLIRATSYFKQNDLNKSLDDFSVILELNPRHIEALYHRGHVLFKLNRFEEAIADFSLLLHLNPSHISGAFARAACYNKMGMLTQAIEDYNFALFKDQTINNNNGISSNNSTNTDDLMMLRSISNTGETYSSSMVRNQLPPNLSPPSYFHPNSSPSNDFTINSPDRPQTSSPTSFNFKDLSELRNNNSYNNISSPRISSENEPENDFTSSKGPIALGAYLNTPRSRTYSWGSTNTKETSNSTSYPTPSVSSQYNNNNLPSPTLSNPNSTTSTLNQQIEGYLMKAFELKKQGKINESIEEFSKIIQIDQNHFKALFNRAFLFDKLGRYSEALEDYSKVIDLEPSNPISYYNRGITYDHINDLSNSLQDFNKAVSLQPYNNDYLLNKALCLKKMNNFNESILVYSNIINQINENASSPNSHDNLSSYLFRALYNRALCYEKVNEIDLGIEDALNGLSIQNNHLPSLVLLSNLYESKLNYSKSIEFITQAIALKNDNPQLLLQRGKIYLKTSQIDYSLNDFDTAINLLLPFINNNLDKNSELINLYINLLQLRISCNKIKQNYNRIIDDSNSILALNSLHVVAFQSLAFAYGKLNNSQESIEVYTNLIKLIENNNNYYEDYVKCFILRAFQYAQRNDINNALDDYDKAISFSIKLEKDNDIIKQNLSIKFKLLRAHTLHNRGILYWKLNKRDLAIKDYNEAVSLDSQYINSSLGLNIKELSSNNINVNNNNSNNNISSSNNYIENLESRQRTNSTSSTDNLNRDNNNISESNSSSSFSQPIPTRPNYFRAPTALINKEKEQKNSFNVSSFLSKLS